MYYIMREIVYMAQTVIRKNMLRGLKTMYMWGNQQERLLNLKEHEVSSETTRQAPPPLLFKK